MMVPDLKQKSVKKQFGIPNSRLFAIIKNRDRILELLNQASFNKIENISVRLTIKAQIKSSYCLVYASKITRCYFWTTTDRESKFILLFHCKYWQVMKQLNI